MMLGPGTAAMNGSHSGLSNKSNSSTASHTRSNSVSNNNTALLATAYQALGEELGSEKLKVVGGYTLGRVIGEGTYGSVHIATHRITGTRCAVKKIPKSLTSQLTREIHHHRLLHHANILHMYEVIATESHIWLVTELCTGGELFDYLVERGRLLEGESRRIFGELVVAVGTLHRKGTVHRDLKLENVFLDGECQVKLGDLGFAREWSRGQKLLDTFCGTTGYASPEMLQGRKYSGEEADIWSLGIILYTLLCGGLPFDDDDEDVMKSLIAKGVYEEPEWLSDEAKDLIRNILQIEPTRRLSIEGILRHPWFSKTIVDPPLDSIPGVEGSVTPFLHSPDRTISGYFSDTRFDGLRAASRLPVDLNDSAVLSNDASPLASPSKEPASAFIDPSDTYIGPYGERHSSISSGKSETGSSRTSVSSGDVHGSENATTSSTITTPSTPIVAETAESPSFSVEDATDDTPRAEHTNDKLAYEHSNTSQRTIRKLDEVARSRPLSQAMNKGRVQVLAKQLEEEEDNSDSQSRQHSYTHHEEHALHLPLAQHSRTPNRTKRRSVSSTLSDRRPSMARGNSNNVQPVPNVDYLAQLNAVPAPFFSSKAEQDLLALLKLVGIDIGQLQHSVNHNACDASSAMWWMLIAKQKQQAADNEHDDQQQQHAEQATTGSASGHDPHSSKVQPTAIQRPFELGAPLTSLPQTLPPRRSVSPDRDAATKDTVPSGKAKAPGQQAAGMPESYATTIANSSPSTPRADPNALIADIEALKPGDHSAPSSPSKKREAAKSRSTSFSMLQRATSAFTAGTLARKKSDDKILDQVAATNQAGLERTRSTNKLLKIPRNRENSNSTDEHDAPILQDTTVPRKAPSPPMLPTSTSHGTLDSMTSMASTSASVNDSPSKGKEGKNRKSQSFLTTFRSWFVEDKRRKQRPPPVSAPTLHVANNAHVIRRPPGYQPPNSAASRRTGPPRRTPSDQRPALHSRRSSSINSRRSSLTMDLPVGSPLDTYGPRRRGSLSRRSAGSRTPTSERGEFFSNSGNSRPSSVHSFSATIKAPIPRHIETRKSSSVASDTPSRMSHNRSPGVKHYQRVTTSSPAARDRHARYTSHAGSLGQLNRAASTTSSHRSNASSRRSSGEYSGQHCAEDKDEIYMQDNISVHSTRRKRTGHERYVYPSSRRIRSPHGSSTSLATMVFPKPKRPIRDVFAKRKGNDGLTDDDWVSDEEEGEYAGGLGQSGSNASKGLTAGDNHWKSRGGSGYDSTRNQDSPVMKTSSSMSSVSHRARPGASRVEQSRLGKPVDNTTRNAIVPPQDWVRPTRVQMPVARPVRIVEEDEEEEE